MENKNGMVVEKVGNTEFLHTHKAGALVPLAQSSIFGGLVGLGVAFVLLRYRVQDWWWYAGLVFVVVTAGIYLYGLRHWFALTRVGRAAAGPVALDAGPVATETRHTVTVSVRDVENGHLRVDIARFEGVTDEQMAAFAYGLLHGAPLAERAWTGKGNLFSIGTYRRLRDELVVRRMCVLNNPKDERQGYALTRRGVAAMEKLAGSLPPTEDG